METLVTAIETAGMFPDSRAQIQASEAISSASMRYISENLQFSRMKNTIFPQASSQLNGYGNNSRTHYGKSTNMTSNMGKFDSILTFDIVRIQRVRF